MGCSTAGAIRLVEVLVVSNTQNNQRLVVVLPGLLHDSADEGAQRAALLALHRLSTKTWSGKQVVPKHKPRRRSWSDHRKLERQMFVDDRLDGPKGPPTPNVQHSCAQRHRNVVSLGSGRLFKHFGGKSSKVYGNLKGDKTPQVRCNLHHSHPSHSPEMPPSPSHNPESHCKLLSSDFEGPAAKATWVLLLFGSSAKEV